jgi:BolA protein
MSRKQKIERTLSQAFSPLHLEVTDESHRHSVPAGSESHFKVLVVAEGFANDSLVSRHRRINALLRDEFASGLHALALHAWTPEEWFEKGGQAPTSPECMGGSKTG